VTTFLTASREEQLAEAARRTRNRKAGRRPTDDGLARGALHPGDVHGDLLYTGPLAYHVVLPWRCLVPDNRKYAPAKDKQGRAVMILTPEYRAAKKKGARLVAEQLKSAPPLSVPVTIVAMLIEPNRSVRRDLANYTKLVHDILSGLAYGDDSQIDDLHWIRDSVDIDQPRLELMVRPR
jgi:Holliday junction resolvase RusA-like endonuclease